MSMRRDFSGFALGVALLIISVLLGVWIWSRWQGEAWVPVALVPPALLAVISLMGAVESIELANRDHKGKRLP